MSSYFYRTTWFVLIFFFFLNTTVLYFYFKTVPDKIKVHCLLEITLCNNSKLLRFSLSKEDYFVSFTRNFIQKEKLPLLLKEPVTVES